MLDAFFWWNGNNMAYFCRLGQKNNNGMTTDTQEAAKMPSYCAAVKQEHLQSIIIPLRDWCQPWCAQASCFWRNYGEAAWDYSCHPLHFISPAASRLQAGFYFVLKLSCVTFVPLACPAFGQALWCKTLKLLSEKFAKRPQPATMLIFFLRPSKMFQIKAFTLE